MQQIWLQIHLSDFLHDSFSATVVCPGLRFVHGKHFEEGSFFVINEVIADVLMTCKGSFGKETKNLV